MRTSSIAPALVLAAACEASTQSAPPPRQAPLMPAAASATPSAIASVATPASSSSAASREQDSTPVAAASCGTPAPNLHDDRPLSTRAPAPAGGNLMSSHFGGGFGFYQVDGSAPAARAATETDTPLELRLHGPGAIGTKDPIRLEVVFANTGTGGLTLIDAMDGSLEHWRDPTYDLYLREETSGTVYRYAFVGGRCGDINSVGPHDYVDLKPGETRANVQGDWADYLKSATIAKPGKYTAWVVYRFCTWQAMGVLLGKDFIRKETHMGMHASNAVALTVTVH